MTNIFVPPGGEPPEDAEVNETAELASLAFAIITETNQDAFGAKFRQEEMRYVGGAIMNRVRDHYRGSSVREAVLKAQQYSRFNPVRNDAGQLVKCPERLALESPAEDLALAIIGVIEKFPQRYSLDLYKQALLIGAEMFQTDEGNPWRNGTVQHPRAAHVHHYYSPISMKPEGSRPSWFDASKEVSIPDTIAPGRFRFFHDIP